MIVCGIDAGSRAMKVVLMESAGQRPVASAHAGQRPDQQVLACELLRQALASSATSPSEVAKTVATGYGRMLIDGADSVVTEITCQAHGVRSLIPGARSIVDIGGQDSKVIFLDDRGVRDFAMNDRCAAGTGQFLEMASARLGIPLAELGRAAAGSRKPREITSMCAVFAETEIVSLLAAGAGPEDVAAGILRSIAQRVASLAARGLEEPVVFTGGAALIRGLDGILALALGKPVAVAPDPHLTAARGAALLACELAAA
jgi:(R)-2-hydroxyacyl-CoA dehydratese activating ATPase